MRAVEAVSMIEPLVLAADWPAPPQVRAYTSLRHGGVSRAPYDSFNLGDHVGDDPGAVAANRARLRQALALPGEPRWLRQVHGTRVVEAAGASPDTEADASYTLERGVVCAVLTADCLPVLLCDRAGTRVAAAHAGWRGLAAGVLERSVAALGVPGNEVVAWLGPAIGPTAFEVGAEVRAAFVQVDPAGVDAFKPNARGRFDADIYALARTRLLAAGVAAIYGGGGCTHSDAQRFFSYRRDGVCGRMASLIWLDPTG
jgi:YfiH family protein